MKQLLCPQLSSTDRNRISLKAWKFGTLWGIGSSFISVSFYEVLNVISKYLEITLSV
jgi:hypothetical protein